MFGTKATESQVAGSTTGDHHLVDITKPRPNDLRRQRVITLPNELEVLLISDPKLQKSAAALDVAVGSLEDPDDDLGMAHFLEHMLFLGTEKYPEVEEYDRYISSNQGSANAYTADERTNYQVEVTHDAFEGALDRFAQFFVAPLFTASFVEREMNAVDSEHQKNLQSDPWRTRMIQWINHREGHPRRKFSTGNLQTLSSIKRDELLEFYRRNYSANVMKLCVMSTASLDELEASVRAKFSAVPNHQRAPLDYPSDLFDRADLPMFIQVQPVADRRDLSLDFPMPPLAPTYRSKPATLLGSLIGHEGAGSLLSKLKRENLATSLSASGDGSSYASTFSVNIGLTEAGRKNIDRVVECFFEYVAVLRRDGLPEYYFNEQRTMAELDFYFREPEEGMWAASTYAALMQDYPAGEMEERTRLLYDYDPALFREFLAYLHPDRLIATLVATDVETNKTETFYGAKYSVRKMNEAQVAAWREAQAPPDLHVPGPNSFIPSDLTLLGNDSKNLPYKLIDDERGTFWFEQDKTFQLPRANVSVLFLTEETNRSPRHRLLATLFGRAITEGLNEWKYDVLEAGLSATVEDESRGIRLRLSGYSQRMPDLIEALSKRLTTVTIDEPTFDAIKDRLAREYANTDYDQAYQQALYEFNYLMTPYQWHRKEYRDLVKDITLEEVKTYAKSVLNRSAIEGVAYGNLDGRTLKGALDAAFAEVSDDILPIERRLRPQEDIVLPKGQSFAHVHSSKSDNACWVRYVQFAERSDRVEAALRLGATALEPGFYGEMRTKQQLGYIVFSGPRLPTGGQGMLFVIQSGDYPAMELGKRAETYLAEAIPAIRSLSDDEFRMLKDSIIAALREKDVDMGERLQTMAFQGVVLGGDFEQKERVAAAVATLTREEVADEFARAFSAGGESDLTVYFDAAGQPASAPKEAIIADQQAFKSTYPTATLGRRS
jgi:insulysin